MTTALTLDDVRKLYGMKAAVDGVSLTLKAGKITCLLGPSGCGKSTLLRLIAGLEPLDGGTVSTDHILSGPGYHLPPEQRDIGFVFQDYALFPHMSVEDNVAFGLKRLDPVERQKRALLQLHRVQLADRAKAFPQALSGGEQQRIALARALATSPGLLLLDEPLSALDALERIRLRQEIRALQQKLGVTTIMVTHDQEEALSVADRIVVMNHGVIEQVGTPLEVYREPASPFVADFVGKVNIIPARVTGGQVRFGSMALPCDGPDRDARVYLRPEDVLARPISPLDAHRFEATIEKIEFLGAYCHVRVASPSLGGNKLMVYLSLNFLSEQSLRVGSSITLRLLPERIKVF